MKTRIYVGVIALIGLALRLFNLGTPKGFVFDELYYVDGARDYLAHGVEVSGNDPEFVVHPPVGKWLIALGIKVFGDSEFGWRFSGAILGTVMIVLIALIAQRLFRNSFLTIAASFLMAVDGLALVHSRTALLDIFLSFFVLLATYLFLMRWHWWTAIALGLAISTKWSALYYLALFGVVALYRTFTHNTGKDLIRPTIKTVLQYALIPLSIYITSWTGWFVSNRGYARDYSANVINSFIHYHSQMLGFHTGLAEKHAYQANPWSWLILGRPTSFFYETPSGCGVSSCSQEILAIGTPILWWAGIFAIALTFGFFVTNRDRISMIILAGIAGTYLPWFLIQSRTTFYFYAISILPFLILALIYSFNWALKYGDYRKQIIGFLVVVALNFIYFLPILLGIEIPYSQWLSRMWLKSWI